MSSWLLVSGTTAAPNMGSVTLWPPPCVPPEGPCRECDPVSPQREGPRALAVGPGAVPGQAALYVRGADSGLRVAPSSSWDHSSPCLLNTTFPAGSCLLTPAGAQGILLVLCSGSAPGNVGGSGGRSPPAIGFVKQGPLGVPAVGLTPGAAS